MDLADHVAPYAPCVEIFECAASGKQGRHSVSSSSKVGCSALEIFSSNSYFVSYVSWDSG